MREIFLGIMCILFVVCYFKAGWNGKVVTTLYLGAMALIFGISMLLNFTLINQNDKLRKKVENKCPEYEEVHNVYRLK